jgi:hypothetical protein
VRLLLVLAVIVSAFVAAGLASPHAARPHAAALALKCGVERWPEKTLADPAAVNVSRRAVASTVDALARLPVVVGINGARGIGTELTRVKVEAKLVGIKGEADGDFHLVIKDPATGAQMIVEFPNQGCTRGASAALRKKMQTARVAVVNACGFTPSSGYHRLKGNVTVSGIPFFDFLHRQTGHAPNGVELHPVLKFAGTCS